MDDNMTNNKKYKLSNEIISSDSYSNDKWKVVVQYGILVLICVMSFLIAKYIVRSEIDGEKSPIDTSERL